MMSSVGMHNRNYAPTNLDLHLRGITYRVDRIGWFRNRHRTFRCYSVPLVGCSIVLI